MKGKITSVLLTVVICMNLFVASAKAEATSTVSVGITDGKQGDFVQIPVELKHCDGFSSLGIEIGYNSEALTLINAEENRTVGATLTKAQDISTNPYNLCWDSASDTVFDGTLVMLTFEIKTDVSGFYPVTVSYYKGRNGNYIDGSSINYNSSFEALNLCYLDGGINVSADNTAALPSVTVQSMSGEKGDIIEIPVTLENNNGFSSLAIEIGYDEAALVLKEVKPNTNVGATFTKAQTYASNPFNMSWDSARNTAFNGTLATLTFEIIAEDGDYPVTVDYYKGRNGDYRDGVNVNYDETFNPLKLCYVAGKVTVDNYNGISLDIEFYEDISDGTVFASLHDENGRLTALETYPAEQHINIRFPEGVTGAYVRVMAWGNNLRPLCKARKIIFE